MPNMDFSAKTMISKAFRQMLGGIVRLALRNGMSFVEFSDISKSLFVEIASKEYGIRGRPTNDSRIALITGINRRDIKKVKESDTGVCDKPQNEPSGMMAKILTAWFQDADYLSANGKPRQLALEGKSPSFAELVSQYGGDIAPVTVLREFKRSHVIEETVDGLIRPVKRFYIPNYLSNTDKSPDFISPEAISFGSSMLVDHINTIFFNLYNTDKAKPKRMELRAVNPKLKKSKVSEFYQYADDLSIDYLNKIDAWLTNNQATDNEDYERVGVGLYYLQGADNSVTKKHSDHKEIETI